MAKQDPGLSFREFMRICRTAKDRFSFLVDAGLSLELEEWPTSNSYRDGFRLHYAGSPVSVRVEYYDQDLVVWFDKGGERIPYLFIDKMLYANKSGFAGCMFGHTKVENVARRIADDVRENYRDILAGDNAIWDNLIALMHAPRTKKKLP